MESFETLANCNLRFIYESYQEVIDKLSDLPMRPDMELDPKTKDMLFDLRLKHVETKHKMEIERLTQMI